MRPDNRDYPLHQCSGTEKKNANSVIFFYRSFDFYFEYFRCCTEKTGETNPCIKMTSTVEDQIVPPNPVEVDSDPEDDPGRMLNVWLGQLQKDMASPTGKLVIKLGFLMFFLWQTESLEKPE